MSNHGHVSFDLPLTGRGDSHILVCRAFRSLSDVSTYISSLISSEEYRLSSVRTLVFQIRRSFILANLDRYESDPHFSAHVDAFFRKLAPKITPTAADRLPLTSDEAHALCNGPNPKYNSLCKFLAVSGCRIHEAAKLRVEAIKTVGSTSFITLIGKNRKERTFYIPTRVVSDVRKIWPSKTYLFEKEGGGKISRQTLAGKVREYSLRILGRTVTPHDFRKLFATVSLNEHPGKIDAIMTIMGNSDYNVFRRHYLQNSLDPRNDLKNVRKIAIGGN